MTQEKPRVIVSRAFEIYQEDLSRLLTLKAQKAQELGLHNIPWVQFWSLLLAVKASRKKAG